ncbi:hypothetical protein U1Q18_048865 [Sarracenia purpurea var. burkii]
MTFAGFTKEQVEELDRKKQWSRALDGSDYLPGMSFLSRRAAQHRRPQDALSASSSHSSASLAESTDSTPSNGCDVGAPEPLVVLVLYLDEHCEWRRRWQVRRQQVLIFQLLINSILPYLSSSEVALLDLTSCNHSTTSDNTNSGQA